MRPWGGGQPTLRNPKAKGWPGAGERLEDTPENREIARRWSWAYVEREREGVRAAIDGRRPARPLRATVDAYLAHREKHVSPNTYSNDRAFTNTLEAKLGADRDLRAVEPADLQAIVDDRIARDYKPSTLHTMRAVWLALFNWLGMEPNPATKVIVPPIPKRELRAFGRAALGKLREAADAVDAKRKRPLARLLLEVAIATGARASELRSLRWEDFDPDAETVRIYRQRAVTGRAETHTKGKRGRTALVLEPFWSDWFDPNARGLVLNLGGEPISDTLAADLFRRITDTAGIAGTLHDLRRTYGRRFLLEAGGHLDELKLALGHKKIRTTEEAYAAVKDEDAMQAVRARRAAGPRLHR